MGLEIALSRGDLGAAWTIDVRIFTDLTLAQEISQFLLINDHQKKVRTDLGLRVVQRSLDEGSLNEDEIKTLQTVVPDTESWKFAASRIASELNTASNSPWQNRIQMPSDPPRSTTLQSFFTSLAPILKDPDIQLTVEQMIKAGQVTTDSTEFVNQTLKNFWNAVVLVNPRANDEPETNVLWAPIGSSACHIALAAILKTILDSSTPDLTTENFKAMMEASTIEDYDYWYTKKGKHQDDTYPKEKGDATMMTGASNYKRLGKQLEKEWRSNLHSNNSTSQKLRYQELGPHSSFFSALKQNTGVRIGVARLLLLCVPRMIYCRLNSNISIQFRREGGANWPSNLGRICRLPALTPPRKT